MRATSREASLIPQVFQQGDKRGRRTDEEQKERLVDARNTEKIGWKEGRRDSQRVERVDLED